MVIPKRHLTWLLAISPVLVGCGDQPPPVEPALAQRSAAYAQTTSLLEATPEPGSEVEALGLSPGLRTAMTKTLTAALTEFEIQPDASMAVLQEFFQEIEAQQAERLDAGDELRNVHP